MRRRNQGGQASLSLGVTVEKIRIESRATVARGLAKFKDLWIPVDEAFLYRRSPIPSLGVKKSSTRLLRITYLGSFQAIETISIPTTLLLIDSHTHAVVHVEGDAG